MIKALLLVFDPVRAWEDIEQRERSLWFVLLVHLVPILALTGAAEYFALTHWGKWVPGGGRYDVKPTDLRSGTWDCSMAAAYCSSSDWLGLSGC
jgi:hypothetical protein